MNREGTVLIDTAGNRLGWLRRSNPSSKGYPECGNRCDDPETLPRQQQRLSRSPLLGGHRLHLRPPNRTILARRFTSEGFSYRSRRRNSRFNPERSTIFRKRRTASCTDSRSRNKILTKFVLPEDLFAIPPPSATHTIPISAGK